SYIDRVLQDLSEEYEAESGRWRQREDLASVTAILNGRISDETRAETVIRYRLPREHIGAIVWSSSPPDIDKHIGEINEAARALAKFANCESQPLVVVRDHTTLWTWLPIRSDYQLDDELLNVELAANHPCIRIALG